MTPALQPVADVAPPPAAGAPANEPMSPGPQPPVTPPPGSASETPAPPATPQAAPQPPAPVPAEGAGIRTRYGAPDFTRREANSELWRYDSPSCAVFFFLQRDGNVLRLRYTETLPRGMDMAADPACVAALDQRTAAAPAPASAPTGSAP